MPTYGVYVRYIIESEDELSATAEIHDRTKDTEDVDEIWVETTYEE